MKLVKWGGAVQGFQVVTFFCQLRILERLTLINLSAIYKSAVEYEQRMKKRPHSKFGAALVQEDKRRGVTQYSLARKMERSARYLNNLEHDRSEPRFTTILLLADAIGMEPGELVDAAARLTWAAYEEEEAGAAAPEEEKTAPKKTGSKENQNKRRVPVRRPAPCVPRAPPPAFMRPALHPLMICLFPHLFETKAVLAKHSPIVEPLLNI